MSKDTKMAVSKDKENNMEKEGTILFKKRNVVKRRLAEILLFEIIFSIPSTALNSMGIITMRYPLIITLVAFLWAFISVNVKQMRRCYCDLRDKKLHYLLNYEAYFVFMVINIASYFILPKKVYAWLFSLTKILVFVDISAPKSIFAFHGVMLVVVMLAIVGVEKRLRRIEAELNAVTIEKDEKTGWAKIVTHNDKVNKENNK